MNFGPEQKWLLCEQCGKEFSILKRKYNDRYRSAKHNAIRKRKKAIAEAEDEIKELKPVVPLLLKKKNLLYKKYFKYHERFYGVSESKIDEEGTRDDTGYMPEATWSELRKLECAWREADEEYDDAWGRLNVNLRYLERVPTWDSPPFWSLPLFFCSEKCKKDYFHPLLSCCTCGRKYRSKRRSIWTESRFANNYCSTKCLKNRPGLESRTFTCLFCGNDFKRNVDANWKGEIDFCSKKCRKNMENLDRRIEKEGFDWDFQKEE